MLANAFAQQRICRLRQMHDGCFSVNGHRIANGRFRVLGVLGVLASTLLCTSGHALGQNATASPTQSDGPVLLGDAPNETYWGIGAGIAFQASPYTGFGTNTVPVPVLYYENKWISAFGTAVDLHIARYKGLSLAVRGSFAAGEGYKASDAPILNGMARRRAAFWFGPALTWESSLGVLTADFLVAGSRGQRASVEFSKGFQFGKFVLGPYVGATWNSRKYTDYYFGVLPSEARADRPAYSGKASFVAQVGGRVNYAVAKNQTLILDVGVSRMSNGITDSPLVSRRYSPQLILVYVYRF